jgi:hypothetical protein
MALSDLHSSLVGPAIDRVDLLGLASVDRRVAPAVLSLIAAGLDLTSIVSRFRQASRRSNTLELDVGGWPRLIELVEAASIVTERGGRRSISAKGNLWKPHPTSCIELRLVGLKFRIDAPALSF